MTVIRIMELSGWGRYPRAQASVHVPQTLSEIDLNVSPQLIARGMGRSYGNAAILSDGVVVLTEKLNRSISFCESTGLLKAEAGVTLAEIIQLCAPKGWFPAVVPGTKWVTLGGCVAADIHGKNHHRDGAFAQHLNEIELLLPDKTRVRCSPEHNSDLFRATLGGMGLTGFITEVVVQLIPIETEAIVAEHIPARDFDQLLELAESEAWDDVYTVAWLDCLAGKKHLGRGILMRGHHANRDELPAKLKTGRQASFNLQFDFPGGVLNRLTVGAFNNLYYRRQALRRGPFLCSQDRFFFPLDRIDAWNRLYGKRGFVQYQCVLPSRTAREGLLQLLEEAIRSRRSSYLAVLKRFGPAGQGLLSFPIEGQTLTMDFPVTDSELFPFLDRMDEIVLKHGGRVYLAKDARMRADIFKSMYPRFGEWLEIKRKIDPQGLFDSDLARRLEMTTT